ncbi:hypothetical protein OESDEN_17151 [Oesophagostomum dentatum]|uniref:Uncharacterized protein n=1 Tax=Oesophagostomum dentatum TaxID=61180 RepID=A0A0B1SI39_OESDE|nr:hypothetical protein OESDEN_17151 [Oesophagostomum dentatum]
MSSPAFINGYFLVFGILPALSIIAPPENSTLANVIAKISEDFSAWDWKREQFLKYSKGIIPAFPCLC